MYRFAHAIVVAGLGVASACAPVSLIPAEDSAPRIAVAYNYVPERPEPKASYGGDNTLEVYVDSQIASSIRRDFFSQAHRTGNLRLVSVPQSRPDGAQLCPVGQGLGTQLEALGVDFVLCVDRSFYYNDVSGAAVATTRVGVFAANGEVVWRGDSTTGVGFRSLKARKDIYLQTAKAAFNSNRAAAAELNRVIATIN